MPSAAYLLESVPLCRCPDVLGGPRSNSGRLVGPENGYMAGRNPTPLLVGAEWCMVKKHAGTELQNRYDTNQISWWRYFSVTYMALEFDVCMTGQLKRYECCMSRLRIKPASTKTRHGNTRWQLHLCAQQQLLHKLTKNTYRYRPTRAACPAPWLLLLLMFCWLGLRHFAFHMSTQRTGRAGSSLTDLIL